MTHLLHLSAAALALAVAACSGPESLGNKSEWSILQGVEHEHRTSSVRAPVVISVSGRRVAGLPRTDGPGLVWVLLNPKHDPLYKQLPDGQFSLSAAQLASLQVSEPAVLAELRAHVRE